MLLQYAERVRRVRKDSEEEKIELAIQGTRAFFESLGHRKDSALRYEIQTVPSEIPETSTVSVGRFCSMSQGTK